MLFNFSIPFPLSPPTQCQLSTHYILEYISGNCHESFKFAMDTFYLRFTEADVPAIHQYYVSTSLLYGSASNPVIGVGPTKQLGCYLYSLHHLLCAIMVK